MIKKASRTPRAEVLEAIEFVKEILSAGEANYWEVKKESEKRGIRSSALYKAKQELRVKKRRQNHKSYLRLPNESRYGAEWQGESVEPSVRYIGEMPSEWIAVIYEGGERE